MISSNHDILWFSSILWLFIPRQLWGSLFKLPPVGVPGLHSGVRLRKLCEDGYQTVLNIYHPIGRNVPVRSYRIPGETKQKILQCYRKNKTVRNHFKDSMNILFDDLEPSFWCCTSCCIQRKFFLHIFLMYFNLPAAEAQVRFSDLSVVLCKGR